jgi:hypothetical protein
MLLEAGEKRRGEERRMLAAAIAVGFNEPDKVDEHFPIQGPRSKPPVDFDDDWMDEVAA